MGGSKGQFLSYFWVPWDIPVQTIEKKGNSTEDVQLYLNNLSLNRSKDEMQIWQSIVKVTILPNTCVFVAMLSLQIGVILLVFGGPKKGL